MQHPIVKAFVDAGCHSWLIGCPETGKALLVDPKVGREEAYKKALADFGLVLVAVADTHTHADHLSDSSRWLAKGLPVFMSRATGCKRPVKRVGDGDSIEVGKLSFQVLEVAGHTQDSIALAGHGLVASGDTLFAGGLARADFRGSDPETLFDSVALRLLTLPDDTVVLPGHGYRDVLFTTIGVEKRKNPALRHASGKEYAHALGAKEGAGNTPDVDQILATNLANVGVANDAGAAPTVACCASHGSADAGMTKIVEETAAEAEAHRAPLTAAGAWVDVRDAWEYRASHIRGARSIPLGEIGFHLDEFNGRRDPMISCLGGVRSLTAARTLKWLDVVDDPISLAGGFKAWQAAGLPIDS